MYGILQSMKTVQKNAAMTIPCKKVENEYIFEVFDVEDLQYLLKPIQ